MTSRADVARLAEANRGIVKMARADLEKLFKTYDPDDPEEFASKLGKVMPALVAEYGNLAAAVAADWYAEVRDKAGTTGRRQERLSNGAAPGAVTGSAFSAAQGLINGGTVEDAFGFAEGAMQRHISYSTRDTIQLNAAHDSAKPAMSVTTTNPDACNYCTDQAGELDYAATWQFHDNCNCMVAVDF